MAKIRVMHVLNTGSYSGAENVAISIIEGTKGYCDSVYVSLSGSIKEVLSDKHINYYPISRISVSELRRAIKNIHPDVIHAHDFTAGIVSALTMTRVPIINHLHNNSPWIMKYCKYSFVYLISSIRYKKILTVSSAVMEEYVFGKFLISKTSVIGNPIDVKKIRKKVVEVKTNKEYDIAFLGRLSQQKNPLLFLEIVKGLKEYFPLLKVVMIGDGELRNQISRKILEYHLEDTIDMKGFQSNPYVILDKAQLCCMPSSWEGFGLAAVEALALGLPVVASPVGGLVTIINETCGYFCKDRDEYIERIKGILDNADLYASLSKGAEKRANQLNNHKKYINTILGIYHKYKK